MFTENDGTESSPIKCNARYTNEALSYRFVGEHEHPRPQQAQTGLVESLAVFYFLVDHPAPVNRYELPVSK